MVLSSFPSPPAPRALLIIKVTAVYCRHLDDTSKQSMITPELALILVNSVYKM